MTKRVTQCPQCQTSFRVTQAQLEIASGAVRCGSCLHIFNATAHWQDKAPTLMPDQVADGLDDDERLIDDNTPLYSDGEEEQETAAHQTPEESAPLFEEGLMAHDEQISTPVETGQPQFSDSFLSLDKESTQTHFQELDNTDTLENTDDSWTTQLLDDETTHSKQTDPEHIQLADDHILDQVETGPVDASLLAALNKPSVSTANDNNDAFTLNQRQNALGNIEPEPIFIPAPRASRKWLKAFGLLGSIIALAALAGQYLYFHFDPLSQDPRYRPWIIKACEHVGCSVPAYRDLDQVHSSKLVVRQHPQRQQALMIDAIITNNALIQQTFPVIELQFSSLSGTPVASRRFTPSEYLAGELTGHTIMPPMQPIHIALEIVDPGQEATNYQLLFHPLK